MKLYENQQVANWALRTIKDKMGTRDPNGPFHASDVYRCLRRTIRSREVPEDPSTDSLMMWLVGFAVQEYVFGAEEDGVTYDGIIFSVDKRIDHHLMEMKTTRRSYEKWPKVKDDDGKDTKTLDKTGEKVRFEPDLLWLVRTQAYCAVNNLNRAHILVFFMYSNEFHCWTVEFTDQELADIRIEGQMRLAVLEKWKPDMPYPSVATRIEDSECRYCAFKDDCMTELLEDGWTDE